MKTQSYAKALYELAEEEDLLDQIYYELREVCALYEENRRLGRFLDIPSIPENERHNALERIFAGQIHRYLLYFLKILSTKRLSEQLRDIFLAYQAHYFAVKNIEIAHVVTAVELSDNLKQILQEKLERMTGKGVILEEEVDPSCIGGMIVTFDHMRIDGAVKTKLEAVKHKLVHASLRLAEDEEGGYYESGRDQ